MKKNLFKRMEFLSLMGMFVAGMMTFTACGSDGPDDPTPPQQLTPTAAALVAAAALAALAAAQVTTHGPIL